MKKLLLPFALVVVFNCALFAQPMLQMNALPNIGDANTFYEADTNNINPGGPGGNQTWNFSNMQPQAGVPGVQYIYLAPSNTPAQYASNFPGANFAVKVNSDTASYGYFDRGTSQFAFHGAINDYFIQKYPNTDIQFKPLAFNGSFSDDFTNYSDAYNGFIFYSKGSRTVKYDAYGTLQTPAGTFPNAMRLKSVSSQVDSVDFGVGQILLHIDITTYNWLAANQPGVLVSVYYTHTISESRFPGLDTIIEDQGVTKAAYYISNFSVGTFERPAELEGVSVELAGANPAIDELALLVTADLGNDHLQMLVTDINGRVLDTRSLAVNAGENRIALPVGHLASGAYFLTLTDGRAVKTLHWQKY